MQLNQLKTFVAIADTGGFAAAAAKLGLTQAAVSTQMKRLEERLGLELFERSVRPPRLNNTGLLLLEQAREIVALSDRFLDTAPVASELKGAVKMGAVPGVSLLIAQTLEHLRGKFRHLQVQVVSNVADDLIHLVSRGRLEAAVITLPPDLDTRLVNRPIVTEPLVVVAPRSLTGKSDIELLMSNPYIVFNRNSEVSRIVERSLQKRRVKVDPIMEFDSVETLLLMVLHGLGVGILPKQCIGERYLDDVYLAPFGSPVMQRTVSLIHKRDNHRQIFLDALYQSLARFAPK